MVPIRPTPPPPPWAGWPRHLRPDRRVAPLARFLLAHRPALALVALLLDRPGQTLHLLDAAHLVGLAEGEAQQAAEELAERGYVLLLGDPGRAFLQLNPAEEAARRLDAFDAWRRACLAEAAQMQRLLTAYAKPQAREET